MIIRNINDGTRVTGIEVVEAQPVEWIVAEIFEAGSPFINFGDVEQISSSCMKGWFTVKAINGEWTYRLTRPVPEMWHTYEARLVQGEVLPRVS